MTRVLGIDPGSRVTGYGCVRVTGEGWGPPELVEAGVFRLGVVKVRRNAGGMPAGVGARTPDRAPLVDRLNELHRDLSALLDRLRPEIVAVESLFAHYKHPQTAIVMGHARGVVLLAAHASGAKLIELEPATVKKATTGSGRASKAQMQSAVQHAFSLPEPPEPADVADALAIALCAADRRKATAAVAESEGRAGPSAS
ncbi:MAG: crossover junction endodeoxyribonuclease RuvC [Planctomycetota bacterium]